MGVVLFDVDGVLRDSYSGHLSTWRSWCVLRGLDEELVGLRTFGRRPRDVVAEVALGLDIDQECALLDRLLKKQGVLPPMAGAAQLLRSLPPTVGRSSRPAPERKYSRGSSGSAFRNRSAPSLVRTCPEASPILPATCSPLTGSVPSQQSASWSKTCRRGSLLADQQE